MEKVVPEIVTPAAQERPPAAAAPVTMLTRRQFLLRNAALFGGVALGEAIGRPHLPEITRHRIPMPGLHEPMRVVQVTDLHRSWCVSQWYLAQVIQQVNRLNPDLIALTGDFVTKHSYYAESCAVLVKELRARFGMVGVLGNHDYWCDENKGAPVVNEILSSVGVEMLTNRNRRLDNGLWIVGLDDVWVGAPDPGRAFSGVGQNDPVLALSHNPNVFPFLENLPCSLLVGHTHGGQIDIPFLLDRYFGKLVYKRGWYVGKRRVNRMYVSRGVGVVGVPFRYHSPPEIAVFDLHPA